MHGTLKKVCFAHQIEVGIAHLIRCAKLGVLSTPYTVFKIGQVLHTIFGVPYTLYFLQCGVPFVSKIDIKRYLAHQAVFSSPGGV